MRNIDRAGSRVKSLAKFFPQHSPTLLTIAVINFSSCSFGFLSNFNWQIQCELSLAASRSFPLKTTFYQHKYSEGRPSPCFDLQATPNKGFAPMGDLECPLPRRGGRKKKVLYKKIPIVTYFSSFTALVARLKDNVGPSHL